MMPALMDCTSSPIPGTRITIVISAKTHDVYFVLADTNGFDQDDITTGGIEYGCGIGSRAGKTAQ